MTNHISRTPTYISWRGMLNRCQSKHPTHESYARRGITVCDRWQSFEAFCEDMGGRPFGMSLDRIDNDQGYSPDNCRWANRAQQNRNRSNSIIVEHDGRKQNLAEWSVELSIPYSYMNEHFHKGWTIDRMISTPKRVSSGGRKFGSGKKFVYGDVAQSIPEWARVYGMNASTLSRRLMRGWPMERALNQPVAQ